MLMGKIGYYFNKLRAITVVFIGIAFFQEARYTSAEVSETTTTQDYPTKQQLALNLLK